MLAGGAGGRAHPVEWYPTGYDPSHPSSHPPVRRTTSISQVEEGARVHLLRLPALAGIIIWLRTHSECWLGHSVAFKMSFSQLIRDIKTAGCLSSRTLFFNVKLCDDADNCVYVNVHVSDTDTRDNKLPASCPICWGEGGGGEGGAPSCELEHGLEKEPRSEILRIGS